MSEQNQPVSRLKPAFYFPLKNGLYEVKPGLFKFPYDFGNARQDQKVFQIDREYPRYRKEKLIARRESLNKYYCHSDTHPHSSSVINKFIIQRLTEEYPDYFQLWQNTTGVTLNCRLSQELLHFDINYQLLARAGNSIITPGYVNGFDALACQIQEDLSIMQLSADGSDKVTALHLCLPNHWAAEDKIGKGFISIHNPVPHMDRMNQSASQIVDSIIRKGPFVRFAWGIATDSRLNHHPQPASSKSQLEWQGRRFNPQHPELYLRVERQTLHSFMKEQLGLFTIRTYLYELNWIREVYPQHIPLLISAIESMSDLSLRYKGLNKDADSIVNWLRTLTSK